MECKSMTSKDVLLHELSLIFWVPTRKMNGSLIMKEISQLMELRTMHFLKGVHSVILNLYI